MSRHSHLVSSRLGKLSRRRILQYVAIVQEPPGKARSLRHYRTRSFNRRVNGCVNGVIDKIDEAELSRAFSGQILAEEQNAPCIAKPDELEH